MASPKKFLLYFTNNRVTGMDCAAKAAKKHHAH